MDFITSSIPEVHITIEDNKCVVVLVDDVSAGGIDVEGDGLSGSIEREIADVDVIAIYIEAEIIRGEIAEARSV